MKTIICLPTLHTTSALVLLVAIQGAPNLRQIISTNA